MSVIYFDSISIPFQVQFRLMAMDATMAATASLEREAQRKKQRESEMNYNEAHYKSQLLRERQLSQHHQLMNKTDYDTLGWQLGHATLISLLCHKCDRLESKTETLFLSVDFLHRLLKQHPVSITAARKYAAVCLRLAVKMNENRDDHCAMDMGGISPDMGTSPDMGISPDWDTDTDVGDELAVLSLLKWQLHVPTSHSFFMHFAHRVWLPEPAIRECIRHLTNMLYYVDGHMIHPSTKALVAMLIVDKQGLMPEACKSVVMEMIGSEQGREREVRQGMVTFEHRCVPSMATSTATVHTEESDGDDQSMPTTYASSGMTTSSHRGSLP